MGKFIALSPSEMFKQIKCLCDSFYSQYSERQHENCTNKFDDHFKR